MAILEIVEYPDKRLREVCKPIETIDERIKTLAADMAETMYEAPGIGLAAIQVGEPVRLVTIDVSPPEEKHLITLINPEIIERDGELVYEEGCLSVPGAFEEVKRAERVVVDYLDLEGERQRIEAEGLLSICLQHEIDHLDGALFIDKLSSIKRKLAKRRVERFKDERAKNLSRGEHA